jgi:branched-subunit amino acid aminotransferase/4-amino-4-deoxychorismate lyase
MSEPLAFFNGQFIPASEARLSLQDVGFVWGATVSERVRTFHGALFRLEDHLKRLAHSLEIVGIHLRYPLEHLADAARKLVEANHPLLDPDDDLGLALFITPGISTGLSGTSAKNPTVGMHTTPLPFGGWVDRYRDGQSLVVTSIQHVPSTCWPPELKCRSRMHYYLADKMAQEIESGARALLLDGTGNVAETSTANVVAYVENEGFIAPPTEKVLQGISVGVLAELARQAGIAFSHRELPLTELLHANEVFLTSTSPCILPVTRINGKPVASGVPGPVFHKMIGAWSRLVDVDIVKQAEQFRDRR